MLKSEKWMKLSGVVICEIFTLITIIMLLAGGEPDRIALAVGTLVLVALPMLIEKLFQCRISLPVYIFALAYSYQILAQGLDCLMVAAVCFGRQKR